MQTPRYEDTKELPLTTDEHVLERVKILVRTAMRRQLWLMFADGDDRQLPLLMPTDVPRSPEDADPANLARFIREMTDGLDVDSISEDDRAWFRLVRDACAMAELRLRGPLLCHTRGVRWVAPEDYAIN